MEAPVAGVGHNNPPLAEVLADETAELKKRSDDLLAAVPRVVITDQESAEKATLLAGMIQAHADKIEKAREERKKPFLEGGRTVDQHYGALRTPLIGADTKRKGGAVAEVLAKIDTYRRQKEEEAEAERRRLEAEAERLRQEAAARERERREAEAAAQREREAAAQRIAEAEAAAKAAGDREAQERAAKERAQADAERRQQEAAETQRRLDAEIANRAEADRIAALQRQAADTRVVPIDSGYGAKAFGRKVVRVEITDLTAAIRHARKLNEQPIREAVQAIYDRQARAGVRDLPGATVTEDTATTLKKGA